MSTYLLWQYFVWRFFGLDVSQNCWIYPPSWNETLIYVALFGKVYRRTYTTNLHLIFYLELLFGQCIFLRLHTYLQLHTLYSIQLFEVFACGQWFAVYALFFLYLSWLATCARKLKVPGSSPVASYVQRSTLCSNLPANV